MSIPKLNMPKFHLTEMGKSNKILRKLRYMGYEVNDAKEALAIFEKHNIDKSQFDFPYGSFESYKQHVLADDLEFDLTSNIMTDEQREEIRINVKEKKIWHIQSNYLEPKH